jgi:hypothetical protein
MLTLDYGGSPDTRSLCPLSLTTNPGGWDALCHAAGSCAAPKLSALTSTRRQARAPRGFGHLLSALAVCVQLGTA